MEITRLARDTVRTGLVIVVGLYVFLNGFAVLAGLVRSHLVSDDVGELLLRIVPSAVGAQAELVGLARRAPDHQWIEQSCRFHTDDSGWVAINFRETCLMRSVTAWRVDSEREARALLPVRGADRWSYDGCTTIGPVGDVGVVESPEATYVDNRLSDGDPWCTSVLNGSDGSHVLVGEREEIGKGRWLVVVAEQHLVDEDIGCVRWSLVFCGNPWVRHAYADWQARRRSSPRPVAGTVESVGEARRGVSHGRVHLRLGEEEGRREVGAADVGSAEVDAEQVGLGEVGAAEVRPDQERTAEGAPAKVARDSLPGQVATGVVGRVGPATAYARAGLGEEPADVLMELVDVAREEGLGIGSGQRLDPVARLGGSIVGGAARDLVEVHQHLVQLAHHREHGAHLAEVAAVAPGDTGVGHLRDLLAGTEALKDGAPGPAVLAQGGVDAAAVVAEQVEARSAAGLVDAEARVGGEGEQDAAQGEAARAVRPQGRRCHRPMVSRDRRWISTSCSGSRRR